jgi:hypothetical protein
MEVILRVVKSWECSRLIFGFELWLREQRAIRETRHARTVDRIAVRSGTVRTYGQAFRGRPQLNAPVESGNLRIPAVTPLISPQKLSSARSQSTRCCPRR